MTTYSTIDSSNPRSNEIDINLPALAIECSGLCGSVAMCSSTTIAMTLLDRKAPTAKTLAPAIQALLRSSQLEIKALQSLLVTIGPGSFTGLRIGLGLARSIAFALPIKLYGVSSLATLAAEFARTQKSNDPPKTMTDAMDVPSDRFITAMNAFRGELFVAAWKWEDHHLQRVCHDQRIDRAALEAWGESLFASSSFSVVTPELASFFVANKPDTDAFARRIVTIEPTALGVLDAARIDSMVEGLKAVLPTYLRASAAEEKRGAISSNKPTSDGLANTKSIP